LKQGPKKWSSLSSNDLNLLEGKYVRIVNGVLSMNNNVISRQAAGGTERRKTWHL